MYKFSKNVRKGVCLLLLFFFLSDLPATTIHAVIFAGTDDVTIGAGNQVSYDLISKELMRIDEISNDLEVEIYDFTGAKFQVDAVSTIKNQLKQENGNLKNDILFFIFIGHGYNPAAQILEYPNLVFLNTSGLESDADIENNSIPFKKIIQDFQLILQPQLFIAYAEACNNNYLEGEDPLSDNTTSAPYNSIFNTATPASRPAKKINDLFLKSKGLVVFTSSKPNQPSRVHSVEGGVFTQAFVSALQSETSVSGNATTSFKSVFDQSKQNVRQIASNYSWNQSPQWTNNLLQKKEEPLVADPPKQRRGIIAWLVAKLTPNKLKRDMKKAFEEGSFMSVNQAIPLDEKGDRMRGKMYQKNPLMYFTQEALVAEEQNEPGDALKYYSIADQLRKEGYVTSTDKKLIKLMQDKDANNLTGIKDFANFSNWLDNKLGIHESIFTDKIDTADVVIEEYESKIKELEENILKDSKEVTVLRAEADSIKLVIEAIDIPREQTVEVELKNLNKVSENTLQEIRQVIKKGREFSSDAPMSEEEVVVGDSEATVNFKYGKRRMNSSLRPDVKGYKVGKYCNEDIINFTSGLMDILLVKLDEVPAADRDAIGIKLQITGNADWRGGEVKPIIRYTAEEKIDEEYKDVNGGDNNFYMEAGETRMISNTELAFLRAYCAYKTTLAILLDKGISRNNIEVYFTALVHPKPANADPRNMEYGKDDRGIGISITIENLYKHYLDKIVQLEERLELIQVEIKSKKEGVADKKERIDGLNESIAIAREEKERLERILYNSRTEPAANTEASNLLEEVKKTW